MPSRTTVPGAGHTLPANPQWIVFQRSDGDPSRWPTNTTKVVDNEGNVNFMRPCGIDESLCIGWRVTIGTAIALKMNMPAGPQYVLKDWPTGYQMFDHNKGSESQPRHDPYLIGSIHAKRFRSAREFINHAYWLMTDSTTERKNCECKYCDGGVPQLVISQRLPGVSRGSATPSITGQSASISLSRQPRSSRITQPRVQSRQRAQPKDYTRMELRPKAAEELPTSNLNEPVNQDRVNDCRAATSRSKMQLLRWLRFGELVWCKIPSGPLGGVIEYWPGTISEYKVKGKAVTPTLPPSASAKSHSRLIATKVSEVDSAGANSRPRKQDEDVVPWTVVQWTEYSVKLFGVNQTVDLLDTQVLPYQVYGPEAHVWEYLRSILYSIPSIDWDVVAEFNPFDIKDNESEENRAEVLKQAVLPFSLAVCVAGQLAAHWTPTHAFYIDRNKGKGRVPGSARILAPGSTRTDWQGLWWGPERIWTDDFVRLKPYRKDYAPLGGDHIRPPSGPSTSTLEDAVMRFGRRGTGAHNSHPSWLGLEDIEKQLGAGQRGLFMHINSLHSIDPPPGSPQASEMFASGMLYELADEDWVEPEGTPRHPPPTGSLPRPLLSYPNILPTAPTKYKFRPILDPGHEAVIPLGLVAGRFYARIHDHPYLRPFVDGALVDANEDLEPEIMPKRHLFSLYGLISGQHNAVDPTQWTESRSVEIKEALKTQKQHIEKLWRENRAPLAKHRLEPPLPDAETMDVD